MLGTLLQSRYRLDSELGRGGMGVVYRAHDTLLDRPVAVKVVSDSKLGTEGRARLLHEARAAARLNHPNIVSVYDAGESDSSPFIVMELVEGQTLRDVSALSLAEALALARQICAALEHAHANGIIHRDLKPENVVVAKSQTAKLMDFGLARAAGAPRITEEGSLVGTASYLAPELIAGDGPSLQSDLYALGVMLYELLAGRPPFGGDTLMAVLSQHLHAPVVPPSTYNPQIPPALDSLLLHLLSKQVENRPATAVEVREALERLTSAEATAASVVELSVLDRIVRGRLVARQGELKQLRELWARASQGHSHLALLSGEPGIGKTRLAREAMVAAQLSGAVVLAGGCYEYEAATPYLPFVEALRQWAVAQFPDALREKLGATAPEVAKLAPEIEERIGPLAPNPPLPPNEERLRLFDNLARFFQSLAAPQGMLIFLDDLHWADQGTLALLHYLLRRLRDSRILILAAYREVELDRTHPLSAALVEWNRERLATRVALGRLSVDDTGTMLAALFGEASVSRELSEAIHRETEGNPFFVEEVVKSLIEQGEIYRENGRWERKAIAELTIPQSIKDAIGRRLNRLSAGCVDVLHTAAALGKVFPFAELAAVTAVNEDQLLDALDEAGAAQLVLAASDESFAFTHDKIREVLYEELNPVRRRRLHQRIGEELEKLYATSPTHVPDIAHHFIQSGDLQRGLKYSLEAAGQARRLFAHDEALRYYQHAAESAEALNLPDQLATIYETLGEVHYGRGVYQSAVEHYLRAMTLIAPDAVARRAALNMKIGIAYTQVGDERGLDSLHRAESELDPGTQTDELANTLAMLGRYHHYYARHRKAIEFYKRALQLAEPLNRVSTLYYIYSFLAGAYQHLAEYASSKAWAHKAIALGERRNSPIPVAGGYEFLAEDVLGQGYWPEALEYAARDREIGEKVGALDRLAWADFCRAWAFFGLGNLPLALETGRAAVALAEQIGDERLAVLAGSFVAQFETDLGFDEEARATAERWLKRSDDLGQVFMQCMGRHGLAYYHLQRGEWAKAAALYDQCAAIYGPTDNRVSALVVGPHPALARLGLGQVDEAARWIADYLTLAREAEAPHCAGCARRIQGQIFAAQGLKEEAAAAFDEAVATLDKLGSRLELGRALYHRGLFRRTIGEAGVAHDDLQNALTIFEACGAKRDRERATRSLA